MLLLILTQTVKLAIVVYVALVQNITVQQLTQLSALFTSTKVSLDEERSFTVNASTVGWVAFGFACFAPNKMQDYDLGLIVAGYKKGHMDISM